LLRWLKSAPGAFVTAGVIVALAALLLALGRDSRTVDAAGSSVLAATTPAAPTTRAPVVSAPATRLKLPRGPHLRILFVGDSLRGSVFASTPDKGWVPEVIDALANRGRTVTELDATKVGRTPGKARGANDIHAVEGGADIAVLEIGTNDVNHVPIGNFARDYRNLLSMIRRTSPGVRLMCLGVWSIPSAPQVTIDPYNAAIAQECHEGVYFPLTDIWRNAGFHGPAGRRTWDGAGDAFHPNDRGYRAIAARVLEHMSR
jgi:acyl-CoA thioesterase-1